MSELHLTPLQEITKKHILQVLAQKKKAAPQSPAAYLLADEVGLGKTKIAAGIIRALAAQKQKGQFIVYYLCGSQRVVAQNVAALSRDCDSAPANDKRLSMQLNKKYEGKLLVLPLTPATTFTNVNSEFNKEEDEYLKKELGKQAAFLELRKEACSKVIREQLPPDLVILDEFQNYNALLYNHTSSYPLFTLLMQKTPYLLMLSATPYQMLTGKVQQLNYRDVLTDVTETNLKAEAQQTEEDTRYAVEDDNFDKLVRFVLDPLHPDAPAPAQTDLYNQVFCRTERRMFYDTEIRDEPVETVRIAPAAAAVHIRRLQQQYDILKKLTKNPTMDRLIAYEKKAPAYPCFATRYTDIKLGGADESLVNDMKYLEWDAHNGGYLPALGKISPDTHAKYALLRDQALADGVEAMLWVPPVLWGREPLSGIDRDNPFVRNRNYTKVIVFGDYRMTTAAPVWYLREETKKRRQQWIDRPTPARTLTEEEEQTLQQYYRDCFSAFAEGESREKARNFVKTLLDENRDLIEAVTGLTGDRARWYYAAQGRLKDVMEEYAFLLRGRNGAQVFAALKECKGMRIKMFGQNLVENESSVQESENTNIQNECLPPCALAERFTEDDTDSNAHKKKHSQFMQMRFNSPFWPFVMTASSVAQEGLDFHWYSHAIAHWSLPKNPMEYIQREGRVDRYLSHLVRKRMHLLFPEKAQFAALEQACLDVASRTRAGTQEKNTDDYRKKRPLYPYWYIGNQDFRNLGIPVPAQLPDFRRLVCVMPLSSEAIFWDKLQAALEQYTATMSPIDWAHPDTALSFCPMLRRQNK